MNNSQVTGYSQKSIEVEQQVLGAILIEPKAFPVAHEIVQADHFTTDAHKEIFKVMTELYANGEPISPVTVSNKDSVDPDKQQFGGKTYIHSLVAQMPTTANIKYYSELVKKYSKLRSIFRVSMEIGSIIHDSDYALDDPDEILSKFESLLFNTLNDSTSGFELKDIVRQEFDRIEELDEKGLNDYGITCGFKGVDKLLTGFKNGDLIIVGARPSVGKTALALNIALQVDIPTAIFSLEMSKAQLAQRMLCVAGQIDSQKLRSCELSDDDWRRLAVAAQKIVNDKTIIIDDTPSLNIIELRSRARRYKQKYGIGLIIVDYLQLMSNYKKNISRDREVAEMSRGLKLLAKELDVPLIALSQLSRGVEMRENKRPRLSDLRDSGAIEQDADVVAFLHRPKDKGDMRFSDIPVEVIIAKHRNGKIGIVELEYIEKYTKFADKLG